MDTLNNENFLTFNTESNEKESCLSQIAGPYDIHPDEAEMSLIEGAITEVQEEKKAIQRYFDGETNLTCLNVEMDGQIEVALFSIAWEHKDLMDEFLQKLYKRLDELEQELQKQALQKDKDEFLLDNEDDLYWLDTPIIYVPYLGG